MDPHCIHWIFSLMIGWHGIAVHMRVLRSAAAVPDTLFVWALMNHSMIQAAFTNRRWGLLALGWISLIVFIVVLRVNTVPRTPERLSVDIDADILSVSSPKADDTNSSSASTAHHLPNR